MELAMLTEAPLRIAAHVGPLLGAWTCDLEWWRFGFHGRGGEGQAGFL